MRQDGKCQQRGRVAFWPESRYNKRKKGGGDVENRQKIMKGFFLVCSVLGRAYAALNMVAFLVGGGMRGLFFSTEMGSAGDIMFMVAVLAWWISFQLYLRTLPEHKLPAWTKKLCVANILAYLGVLGLWLVNYFLTRG